MTLFRHLSGNPILALGRTIPSTRDFENRSMAGKNHDQTCRYLAVSLRRRYTVCTAPERSCGKRSNTRVKQAFTVQMAFDALGQEYTTQAGGRVGLLLTTSSSSLALKRAGK